MLKFKGFFQLFLAAVCLLLVLGTGFNLANILLRPESISVVNALVGQSVLIICFLALARILMRKGLANLKAAGRHADDSATDNTEKSTST